MNTKIYLYSLYYCLLFTVYNLLLGKSPAFAQDFSLSLSPPLVQITARPGKNVIQTYDLLNSSPNPIYLKASILPFMPGDDEGNPDYTKIPGPAEPKVIFSLENSFIHLDENFLLAPNQSQQLILKISLPADLPKKDYYYTLLLSSPPGEFTGASAVKPAIGTHLLISASTLVSPALPLSLAVMKVTGGLFMLPVFDLFFDSPLINIKLENPGDFLATASGQLTLKRGNEIKSQFPLRPDYVLAHSVRTATCQKNDSENNPDCRFSPPFWPGCYQITLQLGKESYKKNIYTLPYKSAVLLTPLIPLAFFFKYGKKFLKKK